MPIATLADLPPPPAGKTGWPWTEASAPLPATPPAGGAWPRFSIVTPSFNDEAFLEETLRSVLLQGYPALEYIVMDGGSSDGSVDIIRRYAPWLSFWISERDGSLARGLNNGFTRASGDLMAWINSSDKYLPNALGIAADLFTRFRDIHWLTASQPSLCDPDGTVRSYHVAGYSRRFFAVGGYTSFAYSTDVLQQESTFWRRSLWEQAGARLDESFRIAIDFDLWWRFYRYTHLVSVESPLGCFRLHPNQSGRRLAETYERECLRVLGMKRPMWMQRPARLYKRAGLGKFMRWRTIARFFYGERVTALVPDGANGWLSQQRWAP